MKESSFITSNSSITSKQIEKRLQMYTNNQKVLSLITTIQNKLYSSGKKKCVFLLIGRTGVGKSSTINTLLGQTIAAVGDDDATTNDVIPYQAQINGNQFIVIDTPGLCESLDLDKDYKYLEKIRSKVKEISSMWFVTNLDATRVDLGEQRAIKLITENLSPQIWENSVIVFTFADNVVASKYAEKLKSRTERVQAAIAQSIEDEIGKNIEDRKVKNTRANAIAYKIPSIAVSNINEITPDGKKWLGELYTQVYTRMDNIGAVPFFLATLKRIKPPDKEVILAQPEPAQTNSPSIELDENQTIKVKNKTREIFEVGAAGATIGGAIGTIFGPVGTAIGAGTGALVGVIVA